jgi:hypothetical protein
MGQEMINQNKGKPPTPMGAFPPPTMPKSGANVTPKAKQNSNYSNYLKQKKAAIPSDTKVKPSGPLFIKPKPKLRPSSGTVNRESSILNHSMSEHVEPSNQELTYSRKFIAKKNTQEFPPKIEKVEVGQASGSKK